MATPTEAQRLEACLRPAGRSPAMFQSWHDLLFLHWAWDPAALQKLLPEGLTVDTHEGRAWVGVVPFWMDRIRPAFCPPVPWVSWFLELNLRTYVHDAQGTPGVWFFSLDCNQPLAVRIARGLFALPYVDATQHGVRPTATTPASFRSHRRGAPPEANRFTWRAMATPAPAVRGTLEWFLVERYVLFSRDRAGRLHSGRVAHTPYAVAKAELVEADTSLFVDEGLGAPGRPCDHALCSPGVDVEVFALESLA